MARTLDVATSGGPARAFVDAAAEPVATLLLGHGAGGGSDARDLAALAAGLPRSGVTVVRLDQPWRVAGRAVAPAPATLDRVWCEIVPALVAQAAAPSAVPGLFLLGGRSAGARVACRTADRLGAAGVVALAFPLHPPGRPDRSRLAELLAPAVPVLVVQGERDPFGVPVEFPPEAHVAGVPGADHAMRVGARAVPGQADVLAAVVEQVAAFVLRIAGRGTP